MIKYTFNTSNSTPNTNTNVRMVTHVNYADLRREIMCFNDEIKWEGMWTHEDVKERLDKGWLFFCLFVDYQIKGWVWLDTDMNTTRNLYVNKDYRNNGYAVDLMNCVCHEAKNNGIEELVSFVDEWNEPTHKMLNKLGWNLID